jgi:chromosome partitioning protein
VAVTGEGFHFSRSAGLDWAGANHFNRDHESMASIIVVTNEKGGVGKTTSAANLAAAFAAQGKRVLAADMDPQRNLTDLLGVSQEAARERSLADAILGKKPVDDFIVATHTPGLDLLPATPKLREVVRLYGASFEQDKLLRRPFDTPALARYDLVIIDTHGSQNCLLTSALARADYYLIPLFPESDAARGVFDVIEYAERVREAANPPLALLGLLVTAYDRRVAVHARVTEALRGYGRKARVRVLDAVIPFSSRVKTAAEQQQLLAALGADAPVARAYADAAAELRPLLRWAGRARPAAPLRLREVAAAVEAIEAMDVVID